MSETNAGISESPLTRLKNFLRPKDTRMAISQKEHQDGITRRSLLGKGAAVAALAVGAKLGIDTIRTRIEEQPKLDIDPKAIYQGNVKFTTAKDRFRTGPYLDHDPVEIVEVYDINVQGNDYFTVTNIPLVEGENPDKEDLLKNPKGDWFAVKAKYKDKLGFMHSGFVFENRSYLTADAAEPDYGVGKDVKVKGFQKDTFTFIMDDGKPFADQVGKVTLPPIPKAA